MIDFFADFRHLQVVFYHPLELNIKIFKCMHMKFSYKQQFSFKNKENLHKR